MYAEKKTIMASLLLAVPRRHFCFVSSWLFFFFFFQFFWSVLLLFCLLCLSVLYVISIVATCPSIPAARFPFCLCFIRLVFVVLFGEPKQNQGRGLVDRKLVQAPQ